MEESEEDLFKDKHEMLNVFQIDRTLDSMNNHANELRLNFLSSLQAEQAYYQSKFYLKNRSPQQKAADDSLKVRAQTFVFDKALKAEKIQALQFAQTKIRQRNEVLKNQAAFMDTFNRDRNEYMIEFHRKFALTVAIIVLFFVGAPLGAIVKKGGFGAPVVIAALLFMIYFVLITAGDNLAMARTVSPFFGMWFATMVLAPVAIWLMRSAANDSPPFSFPLIKKIFRRSR